MANDWNLIIKNKVLDSLLRPTKISPRLLHGEQSWLNHVGRDCFDPRFYLTHDLGCDSNHEGVHRLVAVHIKPLVTILRNPYSYCLWRKTECSFGLISMPVPSCSDGGALPSCCIASLLLCFDKFHIKVERVPNGCGCA